VAAPPDRADDPFVCPVLGISQQAADHSGRFDSLGNGEYTFGPGSAGDPATFNGNVPTRATNADGAGSPGGTHSARRQRLHRHLERQLVTDGPRYELVARPVGGSSPRASRMDRPLRVGFGRAIEEDRLAHSGVGHF
jgi:hypothetical protein